MDSWGSWWVSGLLGGQQGHLVGSRVAWWVAGAVGG